MKLTLITLLLLLGIQGFSQKPQNQKNKWLPLNTYGVTYPRLGVDSILKIPGYVDTPFIPQPERIDWKNSIARTADNKVYIHDGTKWNAISASSSGGGIVTEVDPVFTASAAFSITNTNKTNWNTAFGWGNHATAGYAASSHTHLLSNILQSGATTGQVPQWNGTSWIPATVTSGGTTYVLPTASSSVLGGVKVGAGLSIDGSSVLSAIFTQSAADALYAATGHTHTFAALTSKPTTLSGYGITDAALSSHVHTFASLTTKPTTLSGYGITDAAALSHTHTFASLTSRPTTISGYGITDAFTQAQADALYAALGHTHAFSALTGKPTTLSGYGITDAATASGLSTEITNRTNADAGKLNIADTAGLKVRLAAGTNVSLSGTYPNITVSATGGGSAYTATPPLQLSGSAFGIDPTALEDITTSTTTFTNKRITLRTQSITSSANITPNADNDDVVKVTAQASSIAFINPTGTPTSMQRIVVRVKDNGSARAITFGSQYRAIGVTLPTTTVASKILRFEIEWNSEDTKWDVVQVNQESGFGLLLIVPLMLISLFGKAQRRYVVRNGDTVVYQMPNTSRGIINIPPVERKVTVYRMKGVNSGIFKYVPTSKAIKPKKITTKKK